MERAQISPFAGLIAGPVARRGRTTLTLLSLTVLAACGNPAEHWTRAGVTASQRDADYEACRDLARDASGERVDQDVESSRAAQGVGGPRGGMNSAPPGSMSAGDPDRSAAALADCMTDHGYTGG